MSLLIRTCAALALTLSLPLAAAPAPMHSQFLPSDDLTLLLLRWNGPSER